MSLRSSSLPSGGTPSLVPGSASAACAVGTLPMQQSKIARAAPPESGNTTTGRSFLRASSTVERVPPPPPSTSRTIGTSTTSKVWLLSGQMASSSAARIRISAPHGEPPVLRSSASRKCVWLWSRDTTPLGLLLGLRVEVWRDGDACSARLLPPIALPGVPGMASAAALSP